MMTVTETNITKLSEDYLYEVQDKLYDAGEVGSATYIMIDAELDRRVKNIVKLDTDRKEAELSRQREIAALKEQFNSIRSESGIKVTMQAMVEEFGGEFEDDYSIDLEYVVTSACHNPKNPNQQDTWHHSNMVSAQKHVFRLIYDRVYTRYVRGLENPESYFVARLQAAIVGILKGE